LNQITQIWFEELAEIPKKVLGNLHKEITMPNGGTHLEHLMAAEPEVSEDSLAKISRLAVEFTQRQSELKELEAQVKAKKKEFNKISQELIPESMLAVGMTAFQLDSGQTVSFQEEVSVSVKDYDSLYNFLEDRGDDALMKINLEIGKVPKNILAMIVKTINETYGILATTKLYIHPMTLRSYIKKLCGVGGQSEGEMPLAELDENMISHYRFYKTKVK